VTARSRRVFAAARQRTSASNASSDDERRHDGSRQCADGRLIGYGMALWTPAGAARLIAAALALSFRVGSMAEWLLDGVSALFGS